MSESQNQKKKHKAKKKVAAGAASNSLDKPAKNSVSLEQNSNKNASQESSNKTLDNFIGSIADNKKGVSDESAAKKKKKSKKKSKDAPKETTSENSNSESLLNYSENGIHLLNHPEISVTIAESCVSKGNEIKTTVDKIPPLDEKKPNSNLPVKAGTETTDNANTAKKKKKKKKKNSDNLPSVSSASNEDSIPTPTYTKVVTSDNTCVLVVNNENFSSSAKSMEKAENLKNKMPDNNINFSMPSEKPLGSVLLTKNFTPDTNIFSNSVSIFPVLSNGSHASPMQGAGTSDNAEISHNAEVQANDISSQENTGEINKTKSQLKAERRAKQEAQRAAKLAKSNEKVSNVSSVTNENKNNTMKEKVPPKEKPSKESGSKVNEATNEAVSTKLPIEKESLHKVKLFSHLPQCKKFDIDAKIHPAILEIGFQYYKATICGSNARCIALLEAFVEVIQDYAPHPDRNFCRDLESNIQSYMNFLNNCRPLSVSMMNVVRFLKHEINQMPSDLEVEEIKDRLCNFIFNFVKVEIVLAKEAIANRASYKITDGDVILVLGFSSVIRDVLCKAYEMKKSFKVVVIDTRPKLEGLKMLRHLVKQGLQCSYISINAVSYIMKEVTKVIIGAHAILANGCVMSRLGNKQIALVASTYGVPVFVCCETYKFCERVLTDSFVHNELGEPEDIITTSLIFNDSLKNWRDLPLLQPLNLLYDLTTPNLIAEIVTEKGTLPCTSVPVFLRMRFAGMTQ